MKKPKCQLSGTNGNIFALTATASAVLRKAGLKEQAEEMQHKVIKTHSYADAIGVIMEYVDAR